MKITDILIGVLLLALLGFVMYVVFTYIPMPQEVRMLILVFVVIAGVIFLIKWLRDGGTGISL